MVSLRQPARSDSARAAGLNGVARVAHAAATNPLLALFVALAIVSRCVFWFYTGRVWEDALVTLTAAANAWDGVGLTHHASEPRVLCATSPVSIVIALLGTALGNGLGALRTASLVAAGATIAFGYWIGQRLDFSPVAQALVLSYLALDHSQIFFGMAGMETQLATATLLGCVFHYMQEQWRRLGIFVGLALLCRPEFALVVLVLGAALLVRDRAALRTVVPASVVVVAPWVIFSVLYYGSPVPHTIVAKSFSGRQGIMSVAPEGFWVSLSRSWADVAPFKQFWFSDRVPLPIPVMVAVVSVCLALAIAGVFLTARRHKAIVVVFLALVSFVVFRTGSVTNAYYMWYLTPFMALYFLLVGAGMTVLNTRRPFVGAAVALFIGVPYAMQNVFMMPLDKKAQDRIDWGIRWQTGRRLNEMMQPTDTAVLEPLGYIGFAARNKTIYDYPGVGSRKAVNVVRRMPAPSLAGMVSAMRPTYAVLRPPELSDLQARFPTVARTYRVVEKIGVEKSAIDLSFMGMSYYVTDNHFTILRRIDE